MANTETGHHPSRSYVDRDGVIHLNDTGLRLDESGAQISFDSSIGYLLSIGEVVMLAFDDSAISGNAGASATAGKSCFIETQDGGAGTGAGTAGGDFSLKAGDAGAAAAGVGNAGADGGDLTFTAGAASAVGTQASGTADGGAGGSITIAAGAGGDGGASSGTDGAGGDLILSGGAAGSGGNTGARSGVVSVPDGKIMYVGAISMPGTTEGTNWIGVDVGTPPVGTVATSICIYTNDGDNLSFLHADGTTDDLGT